MNKRISSRAIIIEDGKLLTMFRRKIKSDGSVKEYYVIPGGGLEENETLEDNVIRELKEEFNVDIEVIRFLDKEEYEDTIANYFLCKIINGEPKLGGEELERMSESNYYEVRSVDLNELDSIDINAKDIIKNLKRFEEIMNIELIKVNKIERNKLEKLLQLYLHDLSLYFPLDFDSKKCEYDYDLDKYFDNDFAYFIKSSNDILGFILIDNNGNYNYEISEMFVLNNYKEKQVGTKAIIKVFDLYRGNWVIKAVPKSKVAEKFWIKVVSKYTNNNYKLSHTGKYDRAELSFSNK